MSEREQKRGIPYRGRILVTGDTGFVAASTIPELEKQFPGYDIIRMQGRKLFDLTIQMHAIKMFDQLRRVGPIDFVVNLAALSGGIQDNMNFPARYLYQNLMINLNVIEECSRPDNGVRRLLMFMGGCSFPNKEGKTTPFTEEEMWDGRPIGSSAGYSMAKKMNIVMAESYQKQLGLDSSVLMPTNMIGEWDNFDLKASHVAPALIDRFIEARDEGYETVTVWGSGKPVRDFIYAGDVGKLIPILLAEYQEVGPLSISTGKGTSIAELAETIAKVVGYTGKIHYDRSKPEGQMHKVLDNTKLMSVLADTPYANFEFTSLEEMVSRTAEWYEKRVLGR